MESSGGNITPDEAAKMTNLADLIWHKIKNRKEEGEKKDLKRMQVVMENLLNTDKEKCKTKTKKDRVPPPPKPTTAAEERAAQIQEVLNKKADSKKVEILSRRAKKKQAKAEKSLWSKKPGSWGSMKVKETTLEDKRDLMVLNMRSTINPKQHYKHADIKVPKFYEIGTVEESSAYFYHDRVPKKKRKKTLLGELMADEDFKRETKKKYQEVMASKAKKEGLYQRRAPKRVKKKKK